MPTADAYPFPAQPAPLRFAVALASVGAVFVIDYFFGPLIDEGSHFLLLGTAVMASAWFAGTGPALAATVVGAVVGAWEGPSSLENARGTFSVVVAVHLFGQLADMPALLDASGGVPVIEDAAHAPLSFLQGQMAGGMGTGVTVDYVDTTSCNGNATVTCTAITANYTFTFVAAFLGFSTLAMHAKAQVIRY